MRIAYLNPVIHAQILASKRNETELFNLFSTGCHVERHLKPLVWANICDDKQYFAKYS